VFDVLLVSDSVRGFPREQYEGLITLNHEPGSVEGSQTDPAREREIDSEGERVREGYR